MQLKKAKICFINFANPKTDARLLNLIRTVSKYEKDTVLISIGEKIKAPKQHLLVDESEHPRAWRRWWDFYKKTENSEYIIQSNHYVASDLYSLPIAVRLKKKFGGKITYDSREVYSQLGPLKGKSLKQKVITTLEKSWIKKVDNLIVSGELDGEYLNKHFSKKFNYDVIMNLPPFKKRYDLDLIREKFKITKDQIVAIYQGMLLPGRGLDLILDAAKQNKNIKYILFGKGDYEEFLRNRIHDEKIGNVFLAGLVPYDELHKWTCSADVGLTLFEPVSYSYELALPNKLFEYAMANIPVVATDLPAQRKVLEKYRYGELVPTNINGRELSEIILKIHSKNEKYKEKAVLATREYSYEAQTGKIKNIFSI